MNVHSLRQTVQRCRMLCVGQVTHDRYGADIVAGGCAFFGARCAAGLGAQVRLFTSYGDDFSCSRDLAGLEVHALQGGYTTVFTNLYPPGERRIQKVETVSAPLRAADLPASWRKADVLLLAPVFGEIEPADGWFSLMDAAFRAVCLQGFMKTADAAGRVTAGVSLRERPFFDRADAFFLSEEDIACFGGPDLLPFLMQRADLVFVTRAQDGCDIYTPGGRLHAGVYPTKAVDPTGAGDTFAAACTLGLFAGLDPGNAARLGAAAASVVVEFQGSRELHRIPEAWPRYLKILSPT